MFLYHEIVCHIILNMSNYNFLIKKFKRITKTVIFLKWRNQFNELI